MKTLSETMESLARRGFTEHFGVRGGQLRGFESGSTFGSEGVFIRGYDRFEGVSDPDDMAILYAIESSSGLHGTLVDAFGVYSNPAISSFLERVRFIGPDPVVAVLGGVARSVDAQNVGPKPDRGPTS